MSALASTFGAASTVFAVGAEATGVEDFFESEAGVAFFYAVVF